MPLHELFHLICLRYPLRKHLYITLFYTFNLLNRELMIIIKPTCLSINIESYNAHCTY